ncbi:MAG: hypothetical protein II034_06635 [Muribaculaceae bacterium]|nr:hypothetical protein [Muribaculaceae bacterium]
MNTEDQTIYGAAEQPAANQKTSSKSEDEITWKQVAIAGTSAILLGVGTVAATTLLNNEDADDNATDNDELHVAEVDQNLSFADAFADARHQVGTGGVFHWHGNVYSTFTAEEWDSLTPAERDAFAQQVQPEIADEAQNPTGVEHTAHHTETHHEHHDTPPAKQSTHHEQPEQPEHTEQSQSEEPEHVEHTEQPDLVEHHDQPAGATAQTVTEDVGGAHEPEVHFLGVETGEIEGQPVNVGHMSVDDVHVALIDVDDDRVFEVSVADTNRNNQFDEQDTVEDISDQNLSVDQFAEASLQEASISPDESTLAMNQESQDLAPDMPDYVNDADVQMV